MASASESRPDPDRQLARPSAVNGATRKTAPALTPIAAPPPTLEQLHAQLLAAFDGALTEENLQAWGRWGKQFPFTETQQGEAEDRFHDALERIAFSTREFWR